MGLGGEASNRELAEDSFHGPTSDLQIHNFLECGPDLEGFIFTEMAQEECEPLAKWFPSVSHQGHVTSVRP